MDASGRNAIVTLLANLLSERLDEEQLAAAASVITQLGTTLGFLAAQRALDATRNLNAAQRQALSSDLGWNTISPAQYRNEAIRPYATLFHACGTNAAFSYGLVFWLSSNFR